jgi:hypothetical protein
MPSSATLKKYGLSPEQWSELIASQGYACPICHRKFDEKVRPCIDHLHVRNYRRMKPEKKRMYIRGICCNFDNRRLLSKGMTLAKARAIVQYLEKFEEKIATLSLPD